ncbi:tetratricopeptide repeat protein [Thermus oshimai]|uniref:Tetratricopeptide repeat protein n=1 Tax=Thermus oshimai JL-2 TaxID=751945 RepID=K7R7N9_THEOS|nr:tetratricopeptide repeat protein [Thermus oshimai]AFV77034.1 hypothetical protein Theos_2035 [Thermus oshimai JL-2]
MREDLQEAWGLIEAGRYEEAEACLRQDPTPEARFVLGYALAFGGRLEEALALYQVLYRETGSHKALHQAGFVLRLLGRLEEALAVFKEEARLPLGPLERAVNLYEQGYAALLMGRKGEARSLLEEGLRLAQAAGDPACMAPLHRGLWEWHRRFGSPEAAEAHWEAARRLFLEAGDPRGAEEMGNP